MYYRMSRSVVLLSVVLLSVLLVSHLSAQERRRGDLSGIWDGQIDVKGTILGIMVEFKQG